MGTHRPGGRVHAGRRGGGFRRLRAATRSGASARPRRHRGAVAGAADAAPRHARLGSGSLYSQRQPGDSPCGRRSFGWWRGAPRRTFPRCFKRATQLDSTSKPRLRLARGRSVQGCTAAKVRLNARVRGRWSHGHALTAVGDAVSGVPLAGWDEGPRFGTLRSRRSGTVVEPRRHPKLTLFTGSVRHMPARKRDARGRRSGVPDGRSRAAASDLRSERSHACSYCCRWRLAP